MQTVAERHVVSESHASDLRWMVDLYYQTQKIRIAMGNRVVAIEQGRDHGDLERIRRWHQMFESFEEQVEKEMAREVRGHPVYVWLTSIKGVGPTLAAKLIALCGPDEAMARRDTVSKLWAFAGLKPGARLVKGERASYNIRLKSLMYVVAGSILKAKGKAARIYYDARAYYEANRPDWTKAHVHMAAMRKLEKVLLACLWQVWRESLGLPTRVLYVVEKLGHSHVILPHELSENGYGQ